MQNIANVNHILLFPLLSSFPSLSFTPGGSPLHLSLPSLPPYSFLLTMTSSNPSPLLNQFVVATDFIKVVSSCHECICPFCFFPDAHHAWSSSVYRTARRDNRRRRCQLLHQTQGLPYSYRTQRLSIEFRVSSVMSSPLLLFVTLFSLRLDTFSFGWNSRRVRYRRRYRLITLLPFRIHSSTFSCYWHFNRDFSSQIPYWGELGESIESFPYRNLPYRLSNDA